MQVYEQASLCTQGTVRGDRPQGRHQPWPHLAEVGKLQGLPHSEVGDVLVQLVHEGNRARHVELAPAVPVVAHLALLA